MLFRLATRNIFRQKRRSFLTGLSMAMGMVLVSFSLSLTDGSYETIIGTFTGSHSGHIQIHQSDYLKTPTLYKNIKNYAHISELLEGRPLVESFSPRVYSGSLAYFNKKSTGVYLKGIDPKLEDKTTRISKKFKEGSFFESSNERTIIISEGVSKTLGANEGSEIVFISQGADGSIANDVFVVKGIVNAREQGLEANVVFVPIQTLQEFLAMGSRIHEVAILLKDIDESRAEADNITHLLSDSKLDVQPWPVVLSAFYRAMEADKKGNFVSLTILISIVALGILNTIFMSVMERTREFGVLKAIGTRPDYIFRLIVVENMILAMISLVFGLILALGVNYYFSNHGIQFETPLVYGGLVFAEMKGTLSVKIFFVPAMVIIGTTLLVSMWPGIRASRIIPIEAMSSH